MHGLMACHTVGLGPMERLGLRWVRGTRASLCNYYGGYAWATLDKAYAAHCTGDTVQCTHPYPCAAHSIPVVPQTPSTARSYALWYCSVDIQWICSFQPRNQVGCNAS